MPQYSFMPETKKLRITQKHLMRAIFMQIWQLEVIFDSWLKNKYIIWQAWNYISMQLWFRPVLIGIDRFCSLRELQTNDCECWYARWVLHRDYRYMQNPLNFGAWTICQHLYVGCAVPVNALSSRAAADLLLTRGVKLLVECSNLLPVDLCLCSRWCKW